MSKKEQMGKLRSELASIQADLKSKQVGEIEKGDLRRKEGILKNMIIEAAGQLRLPFTG